MSHLLIVDDQQIVRKEIIRILHESNLAFDRISEADNANKAIEIIDHENPSIILLDIMMPGKNGFVVANHIQETKRHLKIVILTSHPSFEYAREAIHYKVEGYLLKPIDKTELFQILYRLKGESEKQINRNELNYYYSILGSYLQGNSVSIHLGQLFQHTGLSVFHGKNVRVLLLRCPSPLAAETIQTTLLDQGQECIYYYDAKQEAVFIIDGKTDVDSLDKALQSYGNYLGSISSFSGGPESLQKIYRQSKAALEYAFRHGLYGKIITFDPSIIITDIVEKQKGVFLRRVEELTPDNMIPLIDIDGLFGELIQYEEYPAVIKAAMRDLINQCYIDANIDISNAMDYISTWESGSTLLSIQSTAVECFRHLSYEILTKTTDYAKLVDSIIQFVKENYKKDISLTYISNLFDINYYYLSHIFNQYYCSSFSTLLNDIRMEKAVDYLINSNIRIDDIATMTGYSSSQYFHKIFKQRFGITPNGYRKAKRQ